MASTTIVYLVLAALVLCIFLSFKFKMNLGVLGLFFAILIGNIICGNSLNSVIAAWPYKVIFTLTAIPLFFSYANQNGTVEAMADRVMWMFKGASWASPLAVWLVGFIVSTLGGGQYGTVVFLAPIMYSVCKRSEISPLMATGLLIVCNLGGAQYWAGGAATTASLLENAGVTTDIAQRLGTVTAFDQIPNGICLLAATYIILKGWRAKKIEMAPPKPLTDIQKKNLILIFCVVGVALISLILKTFVKSPFTKWIGTYLDVRFLSICGAVVASIMKLGDEKKVVRSLPWNTIFMITGICILMDLAQKNGLSTMLAGVMSTYIPRWAYAAAFVLFGGIMSMFSSALSVVYPTLMPIAWALCQADPTLNLTELMTAIIVGGALTAVSPFSTGGSLLLSACPYPEVSEEMTNKQFLFAFVLLFFAVVFALIGTMKLIR